MTRSDHLFVLKPVVNWEVFIMAHRQLTFVSRTSSADGANTVAFLHGHQIHNVRCDSKRRELSVEHRNASNTEIGALDHKGAHR